MARISETLKDYDASNDFRAVLKHYLHRVFPACRLCEDGLYHRFLRFVRFLWSTREGQVVGKDLGNFKNV